MSTETVPLPVEKLHGLGVVVDDLQKTMAEFSRFFGISKWEIHRLQTGKAFSITAGAEAVEAELIWATGGTQHIHFDLVQPVSGNTIFSEFLNRRGPGTLDMSVAVLTPAQFEAAVPRLARDGVGILQTLTFGDALDIHYLDSVGQLGTVVKVLVPRKAGAETFQYVPVEKTVEIDPGSDLDRLPIDWPYHVCVLTRDRRLSVRDGFRRIFGVNDWFEYDNEAGVTSTGVTYFGRSVEGRFRLTLGRRGKFAVEVVEMLFGENVYQDMLDTKGEGIHHVMTTILSPERLKIANKALESEGYSIVQDGSAGVLYYGYLAAKGKMADLAIEVLTSATDDPAADFGAEPWAILRGPDF